MTNANDVRRAHYLLDELDARAELSQEQEELLRSFLPEMPKQKTLEELRREVYDVWAGTNGNEWPDDMYCDLENWLYKLHKQLRGLEPAKPAHPEFLETEEDYESAPTSTIVAEAGRHPWIKESLGWRHGSAAGASAYASPNLEGKRRVLRWGGANE